jgi:prephenate dehydrogenase/chorismate mutase
MEEAGWRQKTSEQTLPQDIGQMRETIDTLDQTIAALLTQRLLLSSRIGAAKAESGIAVKDEGREQQVLRNVCSMASDPQIATSLSKIYSSIMEESRRVQQELLQAPEPEPTKSPVYFPRVLIVGLGMIGGALAKQIKRVMPNTTISAIDSTNVIELGLAQRVIDRGETDLAKAVANAGLIILAAPPAENLRLLRQIAPLAKRRQVIMDVTSTKREICEVAEELTMKADFVGGHPLFGSERTGLAAAGDVAIDGKRFCIVPTAKSSELTMRRLSRWLSDLNFIVVQAGAQQHDAALARTSHNVQILAAALGSALSRGRSDSELKSVAQLSGTAFESLARLMASPSDLWLDIAGQNKDEIAQALTELIEELRETRHDITTDNDTGLRLRFAEAARVPKALMRVSD